MAERSTAKKRRKADDGPAGRALGVAAAGTPEARIPFDVEKHFFFWFTQVLSRRDRQLNDALKPLGVRVPEWRVLGLLYSRRGLSMTDVADYAAIEPTTLSRSVDGMVKDGLVMRVADTEDKRVTRLALTATGTRLAERVLPIVFRLNETVVAGLPEPLVDLLRWALARMRDNLDASLVPPLAPEVPAPLQRNSRRNRDGTV